MTEPSSGNMSDWDTPGIRLAVISLGALQTGFLIYCFYYIAQRANPKGDGMELLGAIPLLCICLFLTIPALMRAWRNSGLGVALCLVLIAGMLDAMFFLHLAGSLTQAATR